MAGFENAGDGDHHPQTNNRKAGFLGIPLSLYESFRQILSLGFFSHLLQGFHTAGDGLM